ncbi:ATP-grasp domain-containing protein [Dactylosporangium aurantiacum]|uniref:ATP-grasp domain-containing protein n=1 Tax=Dactylosporangium aurantiacum TaxID=35754 RepID=A0A9Q9IPV6_9ACTN|nr:ATP-grasp domain-containing protein [Dactylosporangium aurantiacum]MDG6109846.1 ATP-grasp domain-containing protein [Dactylosporangium aurantiacum]UWZ57830.1 ATP-grasp domain-containing protein [Dactylosporangium aurantiacum]
MIVLVPGDPLRPRRPDEHFAAEADAARAAGLDVAVVDHDALATPDGARRAVARVPEGTGTAVYRGWMLPAGHYPAFAAALAARGVTLRTGPGQYRQAHELPGWYPALAAVTPASAWTTGDDRDGFDRAAATLGPGPAVLRDYTKSMKHHWHEAAYIPDLADTAAAWTVASRFRELRDDDFTGGFVLRRFEPFGTAEVRTWWRGGACRLIGPHPDTPHDAPPAGLDLSTVAPLVAALDLPFVTVDLALRTDGEWRVIELGDGQVSDRPSTVDPGTFVTAVL